MVTHGVPLDLPDERGLDMRCTHIKLTKDGARVTYTLPFSDQKLVMTPQQIESHFIHRPKKPKQEIIVQGKYECMPAAVAMLTGHTLFTVKRAFGQHGWRNDDGGAQWEAVQNGIRSLGFDMIYIGKKKLYQVFEKLPPSILTVPSLNMKGRAHAITWMNGEILDPNIGYAGRKSYGPEWHPWTVGASGAEILLKPLSRIEYEDLMTVVHYSGDNEKDMIQAILECAA